MAEVKPIEGRSLRSMLGAADALLYEDPEAWVRGLKGDSPGVTAAAMGPVEVQASLVPPPNFDLPDPGPVAQPVAPGPGLAAPGAEVLGSETGAPPRSTFKEYAVKPFGLPPPSRVVDASRASRVATFTAPAVGFTIFIGDAGVQPGQGTRLPPGLPYDIVIPGFQEIFAVTDAPVFLQLQVQVAPLLIGDRERRL
jgi:hypothetical protein